MSPTKIQKLVWFDISKSAQIQEYCETGSAVKLQSVEFQNKGHSKYLSDLKLNSSSHATVADNSEIQFERNRLLAQDAIETTIKEVCRFPDGDIVTIDAAFLMFSELDPVDEHCRNGTVKQMLENNFISDATGTIKLTLWD